MDENAGTFIWSWERLEDLVRELRRLSNQSESAELNPVDKGTPQRFHFQWLAKKSSKRFPGLSRAEATAGSPEPRPRRKPEA